MTKLDRILRTQRRVVRAAQLVDCGFSYRQVATRVRSSEWDRLFHGIYGIPPYDEPWDLVVARGALLYAGSEAALAHLSRLALEGVAVAAAEPTHVAVPARRDVRATPGVAIHRLAQVEPTFDPRFPGVPLLSVARSLCQAYSAAGSIRDRQALACAVVAPRLCTAVDVLDAAPRTLPRRRELLATAALVERGCHSPLEIDYYLAVEVAHRLPAGERQVRIATRRGVFIVDVLYRRERVIVEIDGRHHREDPAQRRADELRDAELRALGYRVIRITAGDLRSPARVAARVRALLTCAA